MPRAPKAALAAVLSLGFATLPGASPAQEGRSFLLSFGPDYGAGSARAWDEGYLTFEFRSGRNLWKGLRPLYSFSVNRDGAILGTAGVHAVFRLGPVDITPHFGIGLWQDGSGGFESRELVQFRTGIDMLLPLSPGFSVGLGVYHVSNAGITNRSANLDVLRLALVWKG